MDLQASPGDATRCVCASTRRGTVLRGERSQRRRRFLWVDHARPVSPSESPGRTRGGESSLFCFAVGSFLCHMPDSVQCHTPAHACPSPPQPGSTRRVLPSSGQVAQIQPTRQGSLLGLGVAFSEGWERRAAHRSRIGRVQARCA